MSTANTQGHRVQNFSTHDSSRVHVGDNIFFAHSDDKAECLHMLSSNYRDDKERIARRVSGTCKWFLGHPKFLSWREQKTSKLLWVSADPGCGKSVLSRALVDEGLLATRTRRPSICYFFFNEDDTSRQSGSDALCAILHQLFTQNPALVDHAMRDFKLYGKDLRTMLSILWDILKKVSEDSKIDEIICVLDAIDECKVAREDLIES